VEPKVSIVIPCYNHGKFIKDCVFSVLEQTYDNFEIIIVNDGSTDIFTNNLLRNHFEPKIRVIHTANQGLALARNTGIRDARGEYILPLDADDKIGTTYLEKAVSLLDKAPNLGIVYCYAELFGDRSGKFNLPAFSAKNILLDNMIFCSAFFRKTDWEYVGGYNKNMRYGWEDWDFWLSILELNRDVIRIPEVLFFYRTHANSMTTSMGQYHKVIMMLTLFRNHKSMYLRNIPDLVRSFCGNFI